MTWERAKGERACGACRRSIAAGDPVCLLTEHRLPRCVDCAKRHRLEVPDVWPEPSGPVLVPPTSQATVYRPLAGIAEAFDARLARTGDTE